MTDFFTRSDRWVIAVIVAVLLASVAIMVAAAVARAVETLAWGAAVFVISVVGAAIATAEANLRDLVARNTRLAAMVYAWGGLAMFGIYNYSGLHWQHGWQYGVAMTMIALGLFVFARALPDPGATLDRRALWLAVGHAAAALAALAFLLVSGKLWAGKSDWAANVIFLAGGIAVIAISIATVRGQLRSSWVRS